MSNTKGTDFRDAREAAGMTQEDVAEKFQVHRLTVLRWEKSAYLPLGRSADILRELRDLAERLVA